MNVFAFFRCTIFLTDSCTYAGVTYKRGFVDCENIVDPFSMAVCLPGYASCRSCSGMSSAQPVTITTHKKVDHSVGSKITKIGINVPITCQCIWRKTV